MRGAKLLGFSSEECIVVEDAPTGVGSGVAAGSRVLGVMGTHGSEELYAAEADYVVSSLAGVKVIGVEGGLTLEFEPV